MKKRIFYSWQSDLPNSTNRGFINQALERAISELSSDDEFSMIPFLDRDTEGLTGSPDIVVSIFDKIRVSSVFVCDVSIVNDTEHGSRPTPNPNVLIELGFAISHLGWTNIIMIMNVEFGGIESLPFDLRARRVLPYKMAKDTEDKATERNKVSKTLKEGIKSILLALDSKKSVPSKNKPSAKIVNTSSSIEENAKAKLNVIMNISYIQDRNKMLESEAVKFLNKGMYGLAVEYISEISYIQTRNKLLEDIAMKSMSKKDFSTSEKAISNISYIATRNKLSQLLIKSME